MEEETSQLIREIRELESIFRSHGIDQWASWLNEDADLLAAGDLEGIDHLLSAYGGMGSMSDVFVSREAGDDIEYRDVSEVNRKVSQLRTSIYERATSMRKRRSQG